MWISLLVAALAALLVSGEASSAVVEIGHFGGAVEVGTELAFQKTEAAAGPTRTLNRYRFEEALELETDGFLLTREFVAFHLGGTIGFRQELLDGSSGSGNILSTLPGYDATLNLFPAKPIGLLLFTNRFQDDQVQSFGTDSESLSESFGAVLRLGNPWFPSTISAQQLDSVSTSKGGLFESRRAEIRRLLEYNGEHLSEATNVILKLKAEDVDDASVPAIGDYETYQGNFSLGHRWGPYFEKFWRTTASHLRRAGSFDFESTSANSSFFWDPTDTLDTQLTYGFKDFASSDQQSQHHSGHFVVRHQLYESVRSNLNLLYDHRDQDIGTQNSGGVNAVVTYRKKLPWGGRLLMDLGAGYRIDDRNFTSRDAVASGESLVIANEIGNFLANPRVDTSTILVFETLGGALLIEGIDYTVDVVGEFTSIERVPTGSIVIGDVVFVDYDYKADPSGRVSRTGVRFSVGWDADWIAIGFEHDQTDEALLEGEEQSLQRSRRDTIRLDLRGERGRLSASFGALFGREKTRSTDFDEVALQQELAWQPRRRLHFALNLHESYRNFRMPKRQQLNLNGGLTAFWQIRPGWTAHGFGKVRYVDNSAEQDQRDAGLGLRADFNFGKIHVIPSIVWWNRARGEGVSNDLRGVLRLRRPF